MVSRIKTKIKALLVKDGETVEQLRRRGVKIGDNCQLYSNDIDYGHGYLLEIGNNCIITHATIFTHDASTKIFTGYTKVGRVKIGDNVFIGHGAVILPNVTIGNNVVVGTNTVVRKDIPDNCVVSGNPARIICSTEEFVHKHKERMKDSPVFNTYWEDKTEADKLKEIEELNGRFGYDI